MRWALKKNPLFFGGFFSFSAGCLYVFFNTWRHQGDEVPPGMERDNSGVNTQLGGLMLKEL